MRKITKQEFLALAGVPYGTFKAAVSRGEVALAFGTERALAGGIFLDLDAVAWRFVDELTPAFARKGAAMIVRAFSDVWMKAVARSEHTTEPVWLVVIETGEPLGGKAPAMRAVREGVNVACGTLSEWAQATLADKKTIPNRMTLINVTALVARVRESGSPIGLTLDSPLCPPTDDPNLQKLMTETREVRERLAERVRGDE